MIEIPLEKRCLHIARTTGAIAQVACNRIALQPARLKRWLFAAAAAPLPLPKAKVGDVAARLRTASLLAVAIAGKAWGSLLALPSSQAGRRPLPLLTGRDYSCACHFFQPVVLCYAA